jgi:hypothetical protein
MAAFATTAELTTFLGSDATSARGTMMLDLASALIRRFTGQILDAFTGRQEEFGPTDLDRLFLTQRPVTAVTAVVVDGVTLGTDDYVWTRWGTLYDSSAGAWTGDLTLVTYDGGYAPTDPEMIAVKGICLEVAGRAFLHEPASGPENFGPGSEAIGWAPQIVLRPEEQDRLRDFGSVPVG